MNNKSATGGYTQQMHIQKTLLGQTNNWNFFTGRAFLHRASWHRSLPVGLLGLQFCVGESLFEPIGVIIRRGSMSRPSGSCVYPYLIYVCITNNVVYNILHLSVRLYICPSCLLVFKLQVSIFAIFWWNSVYLHVSA